MTLIDALIDAGDHVARAPLGMPTDLFHEMIYSLIVESDGEFSVMTVEQWRESADKPRVVVVIASGDSFGG